MLSLRKTWMRYAAATIVVLVATLVAAVIQRWTVGRAPWVTYFPAIIIAAMYAGTFPGLYAVCLSALISTLLLKRTTGPFRFDDVGQLIGLGMFIAVGGILVGLCRNTRRAQQSAFVANQTSRESELVTLAKAQELETVIKAVPAAIFLAHDPTCRLVTGSTFTYQLLEMAEGENISQTPATGKPPAHYTICHPDGRQFATEDLPVQRAARGTAQRQVRFDIKFENGKTKSLLGNAEPLFDLYGQPRGSVGAFVDVTSVVESEREARLAGERFRVMADSAPVLVWISDENKTALWFNKGWLDFTGRAAEEEIRHGWTEGIHPEDLARCSELFNSHFQLREPFSTEYRRRNKNGEYRWLLVRSLPLHGGVGGAFSGFIGTCTDITERRASEEQKAGLLDAERAARMEAERIGRMKDEFLATLSHELRTPLSAILGWSQLLTSTALPADQVQQGLDAIARNARAQTQMIEDLLDMSRIISGKIRLNVQQVNPIDVVEAAIESMLPAANAKGVRVVKVLDPSAGPISGDPGRLQQVVWNLLSNAIKFTPKDGKIEILLQRNNSQIEISVSDTGSGIKPGFLPYVFERFRQDDASTTRKHGGLGLGLSIVKQLVELHGGTVRAISAGENSGTTIVVSLPLAATRVDADAPDRQRPAVSTKASEYEPPKLTGVRVLVVDDDQDTRTLIERIFLNNGADVTVADSAPNGLEMIKNLHPQLIVSDIGMPLQDGYEFMRSVRSLSAENGGATPSIALTAFARSEDRQRALMAGYQMHMAKPVEPTELVIACASLVGRSGLAAG